MRTSVCERKRLRSMSSHSSVARKLSHIAVVGVADRTGGGPHPSLPATFAKGERGVLPDQRAADGTLTPLADLVLSPAAIGPAPAPELDGYDPAGAAAVSRRTDHCDLFVLGQDGFLRTAWLNPQERFPQHPWAVGGAKRCRRGSPVLVLSRELDQIDAFAVGEDHKLVTQWWSPIALDWATNHRSLEGPLIAGGSPLVGVAHPGTPDVPGGLDIFYISMDYSIPLSSPQWNAGLRVVQARWAQDQDWHLAPIDGLNGVAAVSGIAAVRDTVGTIHLVVQSRDRASTSYARQTPGGLGKSPPDRAR